MKSRRTLIAADLKAVFPALVEPADLPKCSAPPS